MPGRPARGRQATITTPDSLHYRFGYTDPAIFRAIPYMALGVAEMRVPAVDRYISTAMAQAAARRRMVRHASIPISIGPRARPGERACVNFTRHFQPDFDGHVEAVIFMDTESREL